MKNESLIDGEFARELEGRLARGLDRVPIPAPRAVAALYRSSGLAPVRRVPARFVAVGLAAVLALGTGTLAAAAHGRGPVQMAVELVQAVTLIGDSVNLVPSEPAPAPPVQPAPAAPLLSRELPPVQQAQAPVTAVAERQPESAEKPEKTEKTDSSEKQGGTEKAEKSEKPEKPEKSDKPERGDKGEKPEESGRTDQKASGD